MKLILRIICGLVVGTILGLMLPSQTWLGIPGDLFVGALKAVAPVLVFVLILASLAQSESRFDSRFGLIITLYLLTTLAASIVAIAASFLFPVSVIPAAAAQADAHVTGIGQVLGNLLNNAVTNPVAAIVNANYMGILFWALLLGVALKRQASPETKKTLADLAAAIGRCVRWIINMAPFGVMGLMFTNVATCGLEIFSEYGRLLLVLVGAMLFVAFVTNPLAAFLVLKRNPYPLLWRCIRVSGLTAFFTRSSAANIPVNMQLCENLRLDKNIYSVAIPLGATINMNGAAVTIAVMTLAATHTLNIAVDFWSALLLSLLATCGACGASGVAGGSLLLIPMACSLFGISNDTAMQVVAVGFIIGVVQDSMETALNSSGDAFFAACAEYARWPSQGKDLPSFLGGKLKLDV